MFSVLLFLAACSTSPALARPKTDVLVMKNGDRITCQVKNLDAGVLKVDLDYVDGTISIDWLKVARLESTYLFLVQLEDGSIYSGKLINTEEVKGTPVRIEIRTEEEETVVVDKTSVVRMTQTSDTLAKRLSGKISFGSSYAKGNNTTQYNLGSELDYKETSWGADLNYNSNLTANTGASTSTRNQVDLSSYRMLRWKNYFVGGAMGFLQSSVQDISRQTVLSLDMGKFLKSSNHILLSVMGGFGWQRTQYNPAVESTGTQNTGVALVSSNLQVFTFKKTRLEVTGTVLPVVAQSGRVFAKLNAAYYLKVFGKIDWNLSFYGSWDTQPPPHLASSDYGSTTGLSYTFGNK